MICVGNKIDMDSNRVISHDKALSFANKYNMKYIDILF